MTDNPTIETREADETWILLGLSMLSTTGLEPGGVLALIVTVISVVLTMEQDDAETDEMEASQSAGTGIKSRPIKEITLPAYA